MKKEYVEFFAAWLAPWVLIVTTYIAVQQYRANRLKLRHDFYDRRLILYNAVSEFLAHILSKASVDNTQLIPFLQKTRESYFLFGREVAEYVRLLYEKGVDLEYYNDQLHHSSLPVGEERARLAKEQGELLKWPAAQFDDAQKKFGKELSLK